MPSVVPNKFEEKKEILKCGVIHFFKFKEIKCGLELPEDQAATTELQPMGVLLVELSADRLTRCVICSSELLHSEDHLRIL